MKKSFLNVLALSSLLVATFSCNTITPTSNLKESVKESKSINQNKFYNIIHGKIDFPNKFTTKATPAQVGVAATVSLINPSNHATAPNKTIATGLTDSNGNFAIDPNVNFTPAVGDLFILEGSKRIGRTGKDLITLRTFIRWTATGWESITTPSLVINTKTTALTIITDSQSGVVTPSDTIGKIDVSGANPVVSNINAQITSQNVLDVDTLVTNTLNKDSDPVRFIKYQTSQYQIVNPTPITLPNIHNIHPRVAKPGDTVIIGGEDFSTNISENTVTINGVPAIVTKALKDRIHITVPANASSNFITVQTPEGSSVSSNALTIVKDIPSNTTLNVSNNATASLNPSLGTDLNGLPGVVWEDKNVSNFQNIFYSQWAATTWSTSVDTTPYNSNFTSPNIATDKFGRKYSIYNFGTHLYLSITFNGTSWTVPIDVAWMSSQFADSDITTPTPRIAIGQNKIHIAWILSNEIIFAQNPIINVIDDANNIKTPAQWPVMANISGTALASTQPDIAADSRDIAYITWADKIDVTNNPTGFYQVVYSRVDTSVATAPEKIVLSDNTTSDAVNPSIALDNVDYPSIVWKENNQILYSRSLNREITASWSTPINISNNANTNNNPVIDCDANRYCYSVWENNTDIYYSKMTDNINNTWSTPEKISQATGTARNPDIAIDEVRNMAHIVWESNITDPLYDIYHIGKAINTPANNRIAKITTNKGVIKMLLFEDELPVTTQKFINLVNTNVYDNLTFHRYEPGFVIQGGDPLGNGTGGSGAPIPLEISNRFSFDKVGMVGMARSTPDSATSQFFFTLAPSTFLDGNYSLFATVLSGLDVVQALRIGDIIQDVEIINP